MTTRKSAPKAIGLGNLLNDDITRSIIYEGVTKSQLAQIFNIDKRDIDRKLYGLKPCGKRHEFDIYKLSEAAAYLVPPKAKDIEEAIKRMKPSDLPPSLLKEYWAGQLARLKFERENGDSWPTAAVVELLGEVFKTARMTLLLGRDQVERRTELSDEQRNIIIEIIDDLLNKLADALVERFKHEEGRTPNSQWDSEQDEDIENEDL